MLRDLSFSNFYSKVNHFGRLSVVTVPTTHHQVTTQKSCPSTCFATESRMRFAQAASLPRITGYSKVSHCHVISDRFWRQPGFLRHARRQLAFCDNRQYCNTLSLCTPPLLARFSFFCNTPFAR